MPFQSSFATDDEFSSGGEAAREVAPFLRSLRTMLDREPAAILRWTADGTAFEIHDLPAMTARVLPKYFKHAKYASFQRQLNYFHFRKWTKSRAVVCTFSNAFFQRDAPELTWRITRKRGLSAAHHAARAKAKVAVARKPQPVKPVAASPQMDELDELDSLEWLDTLYPSLERLQADVNAMPPLLTPPRNGGDPWRLSAVLPVDCIAL